MNKPIAPEGSVTVTTESVAGEEDPGAWLDLPVAAGGKSPDASIPPTPPGSRENVCPRCAGSGKLAGADCPACGGAGKVIA